MRIAVMADIHSNHIALGACIAEAKQRHAEEFLFLGDYLGELAYPEKTLELLGWIRSQYPCAFIRGNKEEYWINHKNGKHGDWVWKSGKSGSGMLAYVYGRLTPEQIEEFERIRRLLTTRWMQIKKVAAANHLQQPHEIFMRILFHQEYISPQE